MSLSAMASTGDLQLSGSVLSSLLCFGGIGEFLLLDMPNAAVRANYEKILLHCSDCEKKATI